MASSTCFLYRLGTFFSAICRTGAVAALIAAGSSAAWADCKECQSYIDAISTLERTCLSGSSVEARASFKGFLDIFKKSVEGNAAVSTDMARGARRDWEQKLQREENSDIRICLSDVQKRLLDCLDRCAARQMDLFPRELELQFSISPARAKYAYQFDDRVVLGVKVPPRFRPEKQLVIEDGFFRENIATPIPEGRFHATILRAVRDSFQPPDAPSYTEICLRRNDRPPSSGNLMTRLRCQEGIPCKNFDAMDPGWLTVCDKATELEPPARPVPGTRSFARMMFGEARAAEVGRAWSVPSLESLAARKQMLRDGFTVFTIRSADKLNIDADGVSLDLAVDGTPVLVEGMPAEMLTREFKRGQPLTLQFALQNLDFNGRYGGCDLIMARIQFYKNGERVGSSITLQQRYAALRDLAPNTTKTEQGTMFVWSGQYERSTRPIDWRVFVRSTLLPSWDHLNDRIAVGKVIALLEAARKDIDRLGLSYDGRRLVAIVRPPLTQPSWGLALGTLQESGQIRFTFTKEEAERLRAFALNMRSRGGEAQRLIEPDSFIYIERPNVERPAVCVNAS